MYSHKKWVKGIKLGKHAFIAHRGHNVSIAEKLKAAFEAAQRRAYLYEHNVNLQVDVLSKIKDAVSKSFAFVGIITEDDAESVVWICTEMGMAMMNDLPMILLVEQSAFPKGLGPLQGRENVIRYEKGKEDDAISLIVKHLTATPTATGPSGGEAIAAIGLIAFLVLLARGMDG